MMHVAHHALVPQDSDDDDDDGNHSWGDDHHLTLGESMTGAPAGSEREAPAPPAR
jgi:hypothetical protein